MMNLNGNWFVVNVVVCESEPCKFASNIVGAFARDRHSRDTYTWARACDIRGTRKLARSFGILDGEAWFAHRVGERIHQEQSCTHRTFSGVMSGVMYVVTAVVYTFTTSEISSAVRPARCFSSARQRNRDECVSIGADLIDRLLRAAGSRVVEHTRAYTSCSYEDPPRYLHDDTCLQKVKLTSDRCRPSIMKGSILEDPFDGSLTTFSHTGSRPGDVTRERDGTTVVESTNRFRVCDFPLLTSFPGSARLRLTEVEPVTSYQTIPRISFTLSPSLGGWSSSRSSVTVRRVSMLHAVTPRTEWGDRRGPGSEAVARGGGEKPRGWGEWVFREGAPSSRSFASSALERALPLRGAQAPPGRCHRLEGKYVSKGRRRKSYPKEEEGRRAR
ncbi:hypothetical protein DBV15_00111 [Temnothorax longispinosus]|uniref:Uncharacterized protein n=1 Tax=Temnothorax longispinosus TaxID=300112 RepID=A0A4S2KI24_9HYME|nr:hypothetical protein DBV15_00111 [Temnothorax longispinosus]